MTVSPDAWPRRAAHAEDVFPSATARPEQDEPEQRDAGPLGPDQADPDPPDDGWEPV